MPLDIGRTDRTKSMLIASPGLPWSCSRRNVDRLVGWFAQQSIPGHKSEDGNGASLFGGRDERNCCLEKVESRSHQHHRLRQHMPIHVRLLLQHP